MQVITNVLVTCSQNIQDNEKGHDAEKLTQRTNHRSRLAESCDLTKSSGNITRVSSASVS